MNMRLFKPGGIEALNGVSKERIAEICHVHVSTAGRWKRGEEPSQMALELIQLRETGALGVVDLKWAGWRLHNGQLMSDDGTCFTPGEVRAIPFMRMQIQSYQRDQRLVQQADWVDEKWSPAPEQTELKEIA